MKSFKDNIMFLVIFILICLIAYLALFSVKDNKMEEEYNIVELKHEDHQYLVFKRYNDFEVIHDPKCLKCSKGE